MSFLQAFEERAVADSQRYKQEFKTVFKRDAGTEKA
jgi:hypothetical protein